jgi:hypothetical protein
MRPPNSFPLKIIQRQDDNRLCAGQNFLWLATFLFAALHIIHFAVCALAQPLAEFGHVRWRIAGRYATGIETNLSCIRYELRLQFPFRNLCRHA